MTAYQTLRCQQCAMPFVFSQEEARLYAARGLSAPTLCPICRGMAAAQARDSRRVQYNSRKKGKI
jgi:hypothetical protein